MKWIDIEIDTVPINIINRTFDDKVTKYHVKLHYTEENIRFTKMLQNLTAGKEAIKLVIVQK